MRQSHLYFLAALLFAVATGLNLFNDGFNLKTVLGAVFVGVMTWMGLQQRKSGK